MGDLYDEDILEWSERQARLLRDVAAGRPGNEAPDWANVIEEIESVGRSQLVAVKSLLVQALLHDLKSAAWPLSRDVPHWRAEPRGFRDEAADGFAPSMRQHIDVAELYRKALRRLPESQNGQPPLPVPNACPVTLDDLLGRDERARQRTPGADGRWRTMSLGDKYLTDGTEDPKERAPLLSVLFAYAAMLPMAAGAVGSVAAGSAGAARLTQAWAGAVLCFLSGVRRGLAFRQAGGSTVAQVASMVRLFVLGAGSLLSPRRVPALVLLLLGYGSEIVLNPAAARRGEAPRYFARLRPAQLLIPTASLGLLLLCDRRLSRGRDGRE